MESSPGQPETPALEGGGTAGERRPAPAAAARIWDRASRLADEGPEVVVDCRALDALGGPPLQVLLALAAEIESRGGRLILEDAGPIVMRLLALGGLCPRPSTI